MPFYDLFINSPRYDASNFDELINQLKKLHDALWQASTDSGYHPFDEEGANTALKNFHNYVNSLPPAYIYIEALNSYKFYLFCRNAQTNFSQLYSQMTYEGCSGQLGIAIREWTSQFEVLKQQIIAKINPYAKYLEMIPGKPMVSPIYSLLPRMEGTELSSRLRTIATPPPQFFFGGARVNLPQTPSSAAMRVKPV